jgi:hypothetical protein
MKGTSQVMTLLLLLSDYMTNALKDAHAHGGVNVYENENIML